MRFVLPFLILSFLGIEISAQEIEQDTLIVGYTRAAPFIMESEVGLEGINIWLWERTASALDIEYKLQKMNFSDMLDSLEVGAIDLCINPLTITSERSKKMDFTHSFYASNSTVVTRDTTSFEKFLNFIKSFLSANFLSGLLFLVFIIAVFGLVTWMFERSANNQQFRPGLSGIWDGLWWSAVTMTTVGYGDKSPQSTGGKITALIWMFTALLFISGFTASIASSLTVNRLNWSPKSIIDFKDQRVGTVKSTGTMTYLRTHLFKDVKAFGGLQEGLEALNRKEIDAFLYDEPILRHRIANDPEMADLTILPIKFDLQFYAFAFTDGKEELEERVSQKILEYSESMEWRIILSEYNLSQL